MGNKKKENKGGTGVPKAGSASDAKLQSTVVDRTVSGSAPSVPERVYPFKKASDKECKAQKGREDQLLKSSAKGAVKELPVRPSYGGGKEDPTFNVATNYFEVKLPDKWTLLEYTIEIERTRSRRSLNKRTKSRVIDQLIIALEHKHDLMAFSDGSQTLLTTSNLNQALVHTLEYVEEGQTQAAPDCPTFRITLTYAAMRNVSDLTRHSDGPGTGMALAERQKLLQALNICIGYTSRRYGALTVDSNGRLAPNQRMQDHHDFSGGFRALRAFFFSARAATERVLINTQIKNLIFLKAIALTQVVREFRSTGRSDSDLDNFLRFSSISVSHVQEVGVNGKMLPQYRTIRGVATPKDGRRRLGPVRTDGQPREVKFEGLEHAPIVPNLAATAEQVKFWLDNPPMQGRYVSVYDYFGMNYPHISVTHNSLVVNVGNVDHPIYLPSEVCTILEGQPMKSPLLSAERDQMIGTREIAPFAVRWPSQNVRSIISTGRDLLRSGQGITLSRPNELTVTEELLQVPARQLNSPVVVYRNAHQPVVKDARWHLRDSKLLVVPPLSDWKCLHIIDSREQPTRDLQELINHANNFGTKLAHLDVKLATLAASDVQTLGINPSTDNISELIMVAIQKLVTGGTKLLLVIIPDDKLIYNSVKTLCDIKLGIINQCVMKTKFWKHTTTHIKDTKEDLSARQYCANLALKINLKLGGYNHMLSTKSDIFGKLPPKCTMFVGLDVTHPSPGSKESAPSIASIVSSVSADLGQWPATISIQEESRQEMVSNLKQMFMDQLTRWENHPKNSDLPSYIVVYRDGVSEGQYQTVLDQELPRIKAAIGAKYSKGKTPKIAIIICGKRHNTRFYPIDEEHADATGNCKNGLVVDRGITNVHEWDFFLQAHSALKGTAKPAHYYVVYNELFGIKLGQEPVITTPYGKIENAASQLEQLTHGLCYLFGRATTAVSLCPPAYYADLVCERARCYLSHEFTPSANDNVTANTALIVHPNVAETMFYI